MPRCSSSFNSIRGGGLFLCPTAEWGPRALYIHWWLILTIILQRRFHYSHLTGKGTGSSGWGISSSPSPCSITPHNLGNIAEALLKLSKETAWTQVGLVSSDDLQAQTTEAPWTSISSDINKKRSSLRTLNLMILSLFPYPYFLFFPFLLPLLPDRAQNLLHTSIFFFKGPKIVCNYSADLPKRDQSWYLMCCKWSTF